MNLASRLCAAAPASSMLASAAYVRHLQRGGSARGVHCFARGRELLKGLGHTETFRVVCSEDMAPNDAVPARGEAAVDSATDWGKDEVDGTGGSKPAEGYIDVGDEASDSTVQPGCEEDWEHLEFEHKYEEQSRGSKQRGLLVSLALHMEGVLMQRRVVLTSMDAVEFRGPEAQGDTQVQHVFADRGLLENFLQTSLLAHLSAVLAVLAVICGGSHFSGAMRGGSCALAAMRMAFVLSSLYASEWGGRGLRHWFATFPSLLSITSFFFLTGSYRDFKMLFPLAAALSVCVLVSSNLSPPRVCLHSLFSP